MSSFEKSWTGRFVIGLQLLAWCAVGALLLHRGYTSIKEDVNKPYNLTIVNSYHQTNLSELINTNSLLDKSTSDNLSMMKIAGKSNQIDKHSQTTPGIISSNNLDKQTGSSNISLDHSKEDENVTESNELEVNQVDIVLNKSTVRITTPLFKSTSQVTHNVRIPPHSQKRKYDLTPSGVVMTAIGAIMLVVGPSIVILRCCDSTTSGRRFDKLSADDPALTLADLDLPPTYEEVAGIAPSYSMIFPEDGEPCCSSAQK